MSTMLEQDKTGMEGPSRPSAAWESARYGVLRRLGPALKHDMVVNLQAVAMMAEVLSVRLEKGMPPASDLQRTVGRIHRLAREAVANCLKVAGWIESSEDEGIALSEGIDESLALVRSSFGFRGVELVADVAPTQFEVPRSLLRHLLVACLIALTDQWAGPGQLQVRADVSTGVAVVTLQFIPGQPQAEALPFEPSYRRLDWSDVQALAAAGSVELVRTTDTAAIHLRRMVATSPLGIAPT